MQHEILWQGPWNRSQRGTYCIIHNGSRLFLCSLSSRKPRYGEKNLLWELKMTEDLRQWQRHHPSTCKTNVAIIKFCWTFPCLKECSSYGDVINTTCPFRCLLVLDQGWALCHSADADGLPLPSVLTISYASHMGCRVLYCYTSAISGRPHISSILNKTMVLTMTS